MSQYAKLKAQIADLQAQADDVRRQEVAAVIAEVQQKIAEYGLTAGIWASRSERSAASAEEGAAAPKYRDPKSGAASGAASRHGSSVKPRSFPHRMTESQTKSRIEMRLFYYPISARIGLRHISCGIPCQAPATRRNAG